MEPAALGYGYTSTVVPTGTDRAAPVNQAGTTAAVDGFGHAGTRGSSAKPTDREAHHD